MPVLVMQPNHTANSAAVEVSVIDVEEAHDVISQNAKYAVWREMFLTSFPWSHRAAQRAPT
jgi:hypothetical protein